MLNKKKIEIEVVDIPNGISIEKFQEIADILQVKLVRAVKKLNESVNDYDAIKEVAEIYLSIGELSKVEVL